MGYDDFRIFVQRAVGIILADLDKLQNIADDANSGNSTTTLRTTSRPGEDNFSDESAVDPSRCTIPIAMVCFSTLDMVGQWLKTKQDDDFGSSAHCFFYQLANRDDLKNPDTQNRLKEYFRNGIMHSFFAEGGYHITYPRFDGGSLFVDNATLDARYLLQVVRCGLDTLTREIKKRSHVAEVAFVGYKKWLR